MKKMFVKWVSALKLRKSDIFDSHAYWEKRYLTKGNSGPGSYGRLSIWKADVINSFVERNEIKSVLELGCGDGNQLKLANYKNYIGFDVSSTAINICSKMFEKDKTKVFLNYSTIDSSKVSAELVLSLDVIYHLIEDNIFDTYMKNLFRLSEKFVIIYSSNYNEQVADHVKCRKFTIWIDKNASHNFALIQKIPNLYPFNMDEPLETSRSDFYIYKRKN